ncbi:MAG: ABC transporter permease [Gammaproteobacteria bacterium]|nr:ABC transporter permease [Gammaproteobacteria bacterium]
MRFVFITVWKELKRRFNDPGGLLQAMLIPFAVGALIVTAVGGGGSSITAELMVTDLDDSFLSQGILSALGQGQLAEMITLEEVTLEDGEQRINKGEGSAHLVIPAGFADAWLDRAPFTLPLTVNPSRSITPQLIRETLEALLDVGDYLHKVFGTEIELISQALQDGDTDFPVEDMSAGISGKMTGIAGLVFPPAVTVADATPQPEGTNFSAPLLMLPGILLMAAFFAANGQSSNFWAEREKGTLSRWVASPNAFFAYWVAQWFTAMLLTALVAAPIMLVGFFYVGISFEKYFTTLAWLTLTGPILFALLTLIQVMSPSRKTGSMIATLVMFPLLMIGGSFFPTEAMPDFIGALANYTPNGRVLEPMKGYFSGAHGASGLFADLWGILLVAVVLLFVAGHLSARRTLQ